MDIQIGRLFGSDAKFAASRPRRTPAQWKKTLRAVLAELDRYIAENVDTDEVHRWMLLSGLAGADHSLADEDFWPGYAEGITRLALTLLGDYPDHRRRKHGRRTKGHYRLDAHRSAQWIQTAEQRFKTLLTAGRVGYPRLSAAPQDVLDLYRQRFGFGPDHADFMEWYRVNYPTDYASIFR